MSAADTPSRRLQAKLDLVMPAVLARTRRLWDHPAVRDVYVEWLRDVHGMVRATVPLLLTAVDECLRRTDDVTPRLSAYLARHLREEHGHDGWVAEDYAACGGDVADLETMLPGCPVASLVGSQYYWIRHAHPVALLGHIAVLEGYPPSPDLATRLAGRTGLPEAAFGALARHATLDVRHRDELLRTLDALPLRPRDEALIGMSALHTAGLLPAVIDGVLDRAQRRARRAA